MKVRINPSYTTTNQHMAGENSTNRIMDCKINQFTYGNNKL